MLSSCDDICLRLKLAPSIHFPLWTCVFSLHRISHLNVLNLPVRFWRWCLYEQWKLVVSESICWMCKRWKFKKFQFYLMKTLGGRFWLFTRWHYGRPSIINYKLMRMKWVRAEFRELKSSFYSNLVRVRMKFIFCGLVGSGKHCRNRRKIIFIADFYVFVFTLRMSEWSGGKIFDREKNT